MTPRRFPHALGLAFAALLVGGFQALPSRTRAEPVEWNQGSATALAGRLAEATKAFHEQVQKQPESPAGSAVQGINPGERELFEREARHLEDRAKALAAMLAEGKGRDETLENFKNFDMTLRNVAEEGRSQRQTEPVQEAWTVMDRLHLELASYYGDHDTHPSHEDLSTHPKQEPDGPKQ